jgi:hypothetical protein
MKATDEHDIENEADAQHDGEMATLYGGVDELGGPYPVLVQPSDYGAWAEDSELDELIYAGLLRLAP